LSLLLAASHSTFSVLKTFSGFLVHLGIFAKFVDTASVLNGLVHVLLLFLREGVAEEGGVAVGVGVLIVLLTRKFLVSAWSVFSIIGDFSSRLAFSLLEDLLCI